MLYGTWPLAEQFECQGEATCRALTVFPGRSTISSAFGDREFEAAPAGS
jgi:hypothetical protein